MPNQEVIAMYKKLPSLLEEFLYFFTIVIIPLLMQIARIATPKRYQESGKWNGNIVFA